MPRKTYQIGATSKRKSGTYKKTSSGWVKVKGKGAKASLDKKKVLAKQGKKAAAKKATAKGRAAKKSIGKATRRMSDMDVKKEAAAEHGRRHRAGSPKRGRLKGEGTNLVHHTLRKPKPAPHKAAVHAEVAAAPLGTTAKDIRGDHSFKKVSGDKKGWEATNNLTGEKEMVSDSTVWQNKAMLSAPSEAPVQQAGKAPKMSKEAIQASLEKSRQTLDRQRAEPGYVDPAKDPAWDLPIPKAKPKKPKLGAKARGKMKKAGQVHMGGGMADALLKSQMEKNAFEYAPKASPKSAKPKETKKGKKARQAADAAHWDKQQFLKKRGINPRQEFGADKAFQAEGGSYSDWVKKTHAQITGPDTPAQQKASTQPIVDTSKHKMKAWAKKKKR